MTSHSIKLHKSLQRCSQTIHLYEQFRFKAPRRFVFRVSASDRAQWVDLVEEYCARCVEGRLDINVTRGQTHTTTSRSINYTLQTYVFTWIKRIYVCIVCICVANVYTHEYNLNNNQWLMFFIIISKWIMSSRIEIFNNLI